MVSTRAGFALWLAALVAACSPAPSGSKAVEPPPADDSPSACSGATSQLDLDSNGLPDACETVPSPEPCGQSTTCPRCLHVSLAQSPGGAAAATCLCRYASIRVPTFLLLDANDVAFADLVLADTHAGRAVRCRYARDASAGLTLSPLWCTGTTPGEEISVDFTSLTLWYVPEASSQVSTTVRLDERGCECECPDGSTCDAFGLCVPWPECASSCSDASCGDVCGADCGTCRSTQGCFRGQCLPPNPASGVGCPLRLSVLRDEGPGGILEVGLDMLFSTGDPLPRLADIRLWVAEAHLVSVAAGPVLDAAAKTLLHDATSGEPWQWRDGAYRFVVAGTNTSAMGSGRMMTLTLQRRGYSSGLALQRRAEIFAPIASDALLQMCDYDIPVVVLP